MKLNFDQRRIVAPMHLISEPFSLDIYSFLAERLALLLCGRFVYDGDKILLYRLSHRIYSFRSKQA